MQARHLAEDTHHEQVDPGSRDDSAVRNKKRHQFEAVVLNHFWPTDHLLQNNIRWTTSLRSHLMNYRMKLFRNVLSRIYDTLRGPLEILENQNHCFKAK